MQERITANTVPEKNDVINETNAGNVTATATTTAEMTATTATDMMINIARAIKNGHRSPVFKV